MNHVTFLREEAELARQDGVEITGKGFDGAADEIEQLQAIVELGVKWRSAAVHYGAVTIGLRDGNREAAEVRAHNATTELQVTLDIFNRDTIAAEAAKAKEPE